MSALDNSTGFVTGFDDAALDIVGVEGVVGEPPESRYLICIGRFPDTKGKVEESTGRRI